MRSFHRLATKLKSFRIKFIARQRQRRGCGIVVTGGTRGSLVLLSMRYDCAYVFCVCAKLQISFHKNFCCASADMIKCQRFYTALQGARLHRKLFFCMVNLLIVL